MNIWFASNNAHKKKELEAILQFSNPKLSLIIPAEEGMDFNPKETGTTFCENALIKARELYKLLNEKKYFKDGDAVIADDSGICVEHWTEGREFILHVTAVRREVK